jgi:hypothetical protein
MRQHYSIIYCFMTDLILTQPRPKGAEERHSRHKTTGLITGAREGALCWFLDRRWRQNERANCSHTLRYSMGYIGSTSPGPRAFLSCSGKNSPKRASPHLPLRPYIEARPGRFSANGTDNIEVGSQPNGARFWVASLKSLVSMQALYVPDHVSTTFFASF